MFEGCKIVGMQRQSKDKNVVPQMQLQIRVMGNTDTLKVGNLPLIFKHQTPSYTLPSGYIFGCHISVSNFISGGSFGKFCGKVMIAVNNPPS